jgi:hypothetical protein
MSGGTLLVAMEGYRKAWAMRYLREAKAELKAAKKTPYMAAGFVVEALTKAQASIYYSLGDPTYIVPIVQEAIHTGQEIREPILKFLVEIEKTLQQLANSPTTNNEKTLAQVNEIIDFASDIEKLFGGETSS